MMYRIYDKIYMPALVSSHALTESSAGRPNGSSSRLAPPRARSGQEADGIIRISRHRGRVAWYPSMMH